MQHSRRPSHGALDSALGFRGDTVAVSDCCGPEPEVHPRAVCPSCSARATPVEVSTLKALLTPQALAQLLLGGFRFCANPACDTVYFSDVGQLFRTSDLRVAVWQKERPGARTICYCFGENEAEMQQEIDEHGSTSAVARVRRHISDRRCACDVRNPRGVCCLGDLAAASRRLSASRVSVS